jgi:sorting nexin-8
MSLFGSSPDESHAPALSSKSRSSLFDDEPSPAAGSKSSLFADDDDASGSPWAMPTPKKGGRAELIKNLLPSSSVPDSYVELFDNLVTEDGAGGNISAAGVTKLLSSAKLGADQQSRINNIISSGGQLRELSRNEFNVLIALIALAQEGEDVTLDSVDERRRSR